MPTFTAIALDRLLEPGTSKSVDKSAPTSNPVPKPKFSSKTRAVPKSNLERRNSVAGIDWSLNRPQISPALYATPEVTPVPDSPSSFPPSPYIINHKRRGPRLLKSFSEVDVSSGKKNLDEEAINENTENVENKVVDSTKDLYVTFAIPDFMNEKKPNGVQDSPGRQEVPIASFQGFSVEKQKNDPHVSEMESRNGVFESRIARNGLVVHNNLSMLVALNSEKDGDTEDFFEPQESMSCNSNTDCEDNSAVESSVRLAAVTQAGEFYDAWEELSSGSGLLSSLKDNEADLREMRLNLLMEIDKRRQAEETLHNAQNQWQMMRVELANVGLTLPALPFVVPEDERPVDANPAIELCQQVYVTRFVSESIGRGIAKAEVEMEWEARIEAKNFEIARLWDRLHYYEAVNHEMSQRNQEAVEMARRNRKVRKRRQRWVWGSIAAMITLGTVALAWSYLPATKGSSCTSGSLAPEPDNGSQ